MELLTALRAMDDADMVQVPAVEGNEIIDISSREQAPHYIRLRTELGV